MSELLQIAVNHHLYLFPLLAGGLWLLSKWGADGRKPRPARAAGPAKRSEQGRVQGFTDRKGAAGPTAAMTVAGLQAQQTALERHRLGLERQIGALGAQAGTPGPAAIASRKAAKEKKLK